MSMHKGLLGQSHSGASCDITLGDYIARKQQQVAFEDVAQEKKLTFDEWWTLQVISGKYDGAFEHELAYEAWNAAQENK